MTRRYTSGFDILGLDTDPTPGDPDTILNHSAADVYTTYAQALSDAQNQLDRAMDQAVPVADLANTTVPPLPANATADQASQAKTQQQNVRSTYRGKHPI